MAQKLLNLESAGLPLAMVLALVVGSVTVSLTGSKLVARLEALEIGQKDRWTKQDAVVQALEFKMRNPQLHVPDPRDTTKEILIGGM